MSLGKVVRKIGPATGVRCPSDACYRRQMPVPYPTPNAESYTRTPSHHHLCLAVGAQITSLRVTSSCPEYLHAGVSDRGDLSRHQQEVTHGQLVTMSLVPGTVDSDVVSECHLCCPPPGGHFPRHSLPEKKKREFDWWNCLYELWLTASDAQRLWG